MRTPQADSGSEDESDPWYRLGSSSHDTRYAGPAAAEACRFRATVTIRMQATVTGRLGNPSVIQPRSRGCTPLTALSEASGWPAGPKLPGTSAELGAVPGRAWDLREPNRARGPSCGGESVCTAEATRTARTSIVTGQAGQARRMLRCKV